MRALRVTRLVLKDFRNYERLALDLEGPDQPPGVYIFVGDNGQGKTNLLEAIYLLAMGRSYRASRDADLVRWGAAEAGVSACVQREPAPARVQLVLRRHGPKEMRVNGQLIRRTADLLGYVNVVAFHPDDLQLVKGPPAGRRRFLDVELAQVSAAYRQYLIQYHAALRQRNELLRQVAEGRREEDELAAWVPQLIEAGAQIMVRRAGAVRRLQALAAPLHEQISQGRERLELRYIPFFCRPGEEAPVELEEYRDRFAAALAALRRAELARGQTLAGPHRDNLAFYINGVDAREFGSQGQQRSAVLACKLAEVEFMRAETGEHPILLLDDVMSELDPGRRQHLLAAVEGKVQTFVTTAQLESVPAAARTAATVYRIRRGQVLDDRGQPLDAGG